MPATIVPIGGSRKGVYAVVEACLPGKPQQTVGVLLADPDTGRGWVRFRQSFDDFATPEDAEVLQGIEEHLIQLIAELGGEGCLRCLAECSNVVQISEPETIPVDAFTRALDSLYSRYIEPLAAQPYQTHLPLYSMRAAAGFVGEDIAAEEEDWVRVPLGMRLDRSMIVVHVTGRSMEPRIPDGSLNVFRLNPVGSRQNKILLIQRRGVLDETAGCTVKKYTSVKTATEDGWRHERIRLEPLNPEFEAWDVEPEGFAVVAEWVCALE